jgi:hypothetical protein
VPRPIRIALLAFVLAGAAGAGAYVAAHTDPFPPGVEDPGARPDVGPSPGVEPVERWRLSLRSRSAHRYRVGGSCRTAWRATVALDVDAAGSVRGDGRATLVADEVCDFPVAQVQARALDLLALGDRGARAISFVVSVPGVKPPGADDLGGFRASLARTTFRVPVEDGAGSLRAATSIADGQGGTYRSSFAVRIRCAEGC